MTLLKWLAALAAASLMAGCAGGDDATPTSPPTSNPSPSPSAGMLVTLSSRADLVSGGDALVEFVPASGVDASSATVQLNDATISAQFSKGADGRYVSLISGLKTGDNKLSVSAAGATASLVMTNRANGAPVIYGPQIAPWICDAGSSDAACNRQVAYSYVYKSTDSTKPALLPYDPNNPPADVDLAVVNGAAIPFVVRIETGIINRDYYSIAVLFDQSKPWQPGAPQAGWNRKVVYTHGAGYGMGFSPFVDITPARVQNAYALSKGFAVMTTALNDTGHNSNIAVQAESMMLLRQHFIKTYGEIRYSIGTGSSGGALAQSWVANAYPGIYDGIIVAASFPDGASPLSEIEDCALLRRYLTDSTMWSPGVTWTAQQKLAAQGQSLGDVCHEWAHGIQALGGDVDFGFTQVLDPVHQGTYAYPTIAATAFGGCDLPLSYLFNPTFNVTGVRCSAQDYFVGIAGKRSTDGFAKRVYSNVGIQYGLNALKSGAITVAQFVDLNDKIGAHTINYEYQPYRVAADDGVMDNAYRSGYLNSANNLQDVAIIDVRSPDTAGIHHQFRSWATRARLDKVQGHHKNQVLWFNSPKSMNDALDAMDAWLAAVNADTSTATLASKIVSARPTTLLDLCGNGDGTGMTMQQCTGVPDGSPRVTAGAPLSDDVLECQLAPLDRASYGVQFTDAQWARMAATFPTGACDYTKAGRGQQSTVAWQTYLKADGSIVYGGAPLGPPPTSK